MIVARTRTPQISSEIYEQKLTEYLNGLTAERLRPLKFASFLDLGCGTDMRLAQSVIEQGKIYMGVDNGSTKQDGKQFGHAATLDRKLNTFYKFRTTLADKFFVHQVNLTELPPNKLVADVSHLRLVLRHIEPQQRKTAVQEMFRHTWSTAILMEEDWSSVSSSNHIARSHIDLFREYSVKLMEKRGIDPFVGKNLQSLVEPLAPSLVKYERLQRPENCYGELLQAWCMVHELLAKELPKTHELAEKFSQLRGAFTALFNANVRLPFVPPDIYVATVTLKQSR